MLPAFLWQRGPRRGLVSSRVSGPIESDCLVQHSERSGSAPVPGHPGAIFQDLLEVQRKGRGGSKGGCSSFEAPRPQDP
eukprot:2317531-Pyramimonas_sp.AAC.1